MTGSAYTLWIISTTPSGRFVGNRYVVAKHLIGIPTARDDTIFEDRLDCLRARLSKHFKPDTRFANAREEVAEFVEAWAA